MNHFRNWKPFLFSLTMALALLLGVSSPVLAQDQTCTGPLAAVTVAGNVTVPENADCTLSGTIVQGNVLVLRGATLDAASVQVTGSIMTDNILRDADVVSVTDNSSVDGSIQVFGSGSVTIRDVTIGQNLQFEHNGGAIVVDGNTIGGHLQANENTGGLIITGNTITGNLDCVANNPAPTGSNNQVSGELMNQCMNFGVDPGGEPLPFSVFLPVAMN